LLHTEFPCDTSMYICIIYMHPIGTSPLFFFILPYSLWWFQQVLEFYIHSCIENISTLFKFLVSLHPPPLYMTCVATFMSNRLK
jgi:hypothetical protein